MTWLHDDRLRLILTWAHPALPMEGRVALTLKVVAGLSTEAIAQAFLTTEATSCSGRNARSPTLVSPTGCRPRQPCSNGSTGCWPSST